MWNSFLYVELFGIFINYISYSLMFSVQLWPADMYFWWIYVLQFALRHLRYFYGTYGCIGFILWNWSVHWPAEVNSILLFFVHLRGLFIYLIFATSLLDHCLCKCIFTGRVYMQDPNPPLWSKEWIHSSLGPKLQWWRFFFSSLTNITFLTWQKKYYITEFQDFFAVWCTMMVLSSQVIALKLKGMETRLHFVI